MYSKVIARTDKHTHTDTTKTLPTAHAGGNPSHHNILIVKVDWKTLHGRVGWGGYDRLREMGGNDINCLCTSLTIFSNVVFKLVI